MSFDVLMVALVLAGIGLSAAYVSAEYRNWREHGAAERRRAAALRELHAARLSEQREAHLLPSVVQLQGFGTAEAANNRGNSSANPVVERRKRLRQRATPA
jgi:hypothetical protein